MKVWVTRDEPPDGPLCTALQRHDIKPLLEPVVQRLLLSDAAEQVAGLGPDDWLVLTSAFVAERLAMSDVPQVAVVGPATCERARARGFGVVMEGDDGTARTLFGQLRAQVRTGTVLHPRSSQTDAAAPWEDVFVVSPVVYETRPREYDPTIQDRADVIAVASPSAVAAMHDIHRPVASIGPTTTAALRGRGVEPWLQSRRPTFADLASAIARGAPGSQGTETTR